jgi:hypothetical protein
VSSTNEAIMDFRIKGLPAGEFAHLAGLSEASLRELGVQRMHVHEQPGFPDRIALRDARVGESVLLLNYEHQAQATPYRSRHAIFVIEGERDTYDAVNAVPEVMRRRMLSLRAFDETGMMLDADLVDGREVEGLIERLLANPQAAYLHAHYAKRGCFAARIERSH